MLGRDVLGVVTIAFVFASVGCGPSSDDDDGPSLDADGSGDVGDVPDAGDAGELDASADAASDAGTDALGDPAEDADPVPISCVATELEYGRLVFEVTSPNASEAEVLVEFSRDGSTFEPANARIGNNPRSEATGTSIEWLWDSEVDGFPPCGSATVRVTADDGVASPTTCSITANICQVISGCRVVDALGTTAIGPTGVVPSYVPMLGGQPPPNGDIADANANATHFWDFDYVGVNEGAFNSTIQLTDESGANVGNPVVLMSAGMDYTTNDPDPVAPCRDADTFQVVLEATVDGELVDLADNAGGIDAGLTTVWASSDRNSISVSESGLLTAEAENTCQTIRWELGAGMSTDFELADDCRSGEFVACVDSGGIDTPTRAEWLPLGDVDANLPGMPSGPPAPQVGDVFGVTMVVNVEDSGVGAYSLRGMFQDELVIPAEDVDTRSVGGSTQPALGQPFAVSTVVAREVRWNDVDAFADTDGIFDISTLHLEALSAGDVLFRTVNEVIADGGACTIWVDDECMPYNSYMCNATPANGYATRGGTGLITIEE